MEWDGRYACVHLRRRYARPLRGGAGDNRIDSEALETETEPVGGRVRSCNSAGAGNHGSRNDDCIPRSGTGRRATASGLVGQVSLVAMAYPGMVDQGTPDGPLCGESRFLRVSDGIEIPNRSQRCCGHWSRNHGDVHVGNAVVRPDGRHNHWTRPCRSDYGRNNGRQGT